MAGPVELSGAQALVTGASGFIGGRLCKRLLEIGVEVHASSRQERASTDVRWWKADTSDADSSLDLFREVRPDVVFHLASQVTGSRDRDAVLPTLRGNLLSAVNVLLGALETDCRRVILAGSLEEPDEGEPIPVSPYAAAKSAAGAYARMFHRLYGVPVVTLRIFMVYGPGQRDETKLVPYVITSLLRDEAPRLSSGTRPVDWIFVDDVVEALVAGAASPGVEGSTFDVGSGVLTPIRAVVEAIARQMQTPLGPEFGARPDRPDERVLAADVARTRAALGWAPQTTLEAGLAATIEWYATREQA